MFLSRNNDSNLKFSLNYVSIIVCLAKKQLKEKSQMSKTQLKTHWF